MTSPENRSRSAPAAALRAKRPRVADERDRELPPATRRLEFEERIGTGSVVDFLFAPILMITNGIGWTHREPGPDRRDFWLSLGFYTVAAIVFMLREVL
ncbi:MAG TPA: hypothetical protein VFL14_11835 [Xanthomonadales bacterium]|nr:hypothetical protein [Xanthomonadales bacterium]